jgi:nucleoside-diphosphate-sugar epimerase
MSLARVLITGGTGLGGSHIVDQLTEERIAEIIAVDNFDRFVGRRYSSIPGRGADSRHMGIFPSAVGQEPVVRLQAGGPKGGQTSVPLPPERVFPH